MSMLTMNENCFVLLEDPLMPNRGDVPATGHDPSTSHPQQQNLGHYRSTFLTLRPPGALEQLLTQLKAKWTPVRQSATQSTHGSGQQLAIDGFVFSIGNDWLVRFGNVVLAGGTVKGMLIEAEYLPIPSLYSNSPDGTTDLLSNLLTSVLPNLPDAKTAAISMSDAQWEDVIWDREVEEQEQMRTAQSSSRHAGDNDDLYVYGDEPEEKKLGDWVGVDRDRRSAYLIIGALKQEGII